MLEYLQQIFTPETITVIIGLIGAAISVIKMAISLKNTTKQHVQSVKEIAESVKVASAESAEKIIIEEIKPFIQELKVVKGSLQTFSKIFLLMQEDTPNSKLAIMQLIEDLGQVDVKEIDEVRQEVLELISTNEKKEEEKQEKLTKISEGRY